MLNLTGNKLVKFLYQHQNTKAFDDVVYKIENYKKFKNFSIDDIYVFLLIYAPKFIHDSRHKKYKNEEVINNTDKKLSNIFRNILSKSPRLNNKNFSIPAHIPFLSFSQKKEKMHTKNSMFIFLDDFGYYASQKIPSTQQNISTQLNLNNSNSQNFYYSYNKKNNYKISPLLRGIKNIVKAQQKYNIHYGEITLNHIIPYSSILLRKHNQCPTFNSTQKRDLCLNDQSVINVNNILYLSRLKRNCQTFVLNQISSKGFESLDNFFIHLNNKSSFDLLVSTKIFHNLNSSTFFKFINYENENDFELINQWFPKQSIINKNITIEDHLNSLNCIDIFCNAKTLLSLQISRNFNYNITGGYLKLNKKRITAFELINNDISQDYFLKNTNLIFEILSYYHSEKEIIELLKNDNIKKAITEFFINMDDNLLSKNKEFLLSNILEISIKNNIWKPSIKQLRIIKQYLEMKIKNEANFFNLKNDNHKENIDLINTLLFQLELDNFIPKNDLLTNKINKY